MARRKVKLVYTPYGGNPDIDVVYELPFGRDVIVPGDKIKFKNDRGVYIFQRLCSHRKTGNVWIDCLSEDRKSFNSKRIEKLKGVIRPKKSRRKKQ
jgi:hypothetical protein